MARAMWKGAISFGLVNIPISLNLAVRQKGIRFHQLHDADGGRIKEKRVCERDGKEVPYEHVVKGYEISKGRYVTVTRDELKAIDPVADKTVSIEAFVELSEIDPVFFERSYYVSPEGKSSAKAYALLAGALEKSDRAALARIVLSTSQHMCVIRAEDGALVLTTMVFGDEIEEAPHIGSATTSAAELKMAQTLIDQMTKKFDPKEYKDEHRERVLALLNQKAKGKTIEPAPVEHVAQVTNLMDALERSLAAGKNGKGKAAKAESEDHPKRRAAGGGRHRAAHVH
jgi:DNA end-binding protein Ku